MSLGKTDVILLVMVFYRNVPSDWGYFFFSGFDSRLVYGREKVRNHVYFR